MNKLSGKKLGDEVISDPQEIEELWEVAEASDKILLIQTIIKELKHLVSMLKDDTEEGTEAENMATAAKETLRNAELEIKYLLDTYFGVGALVNVDGQSDRVISDDYVGWGARSVGDLETSEESGLHVPPRIPIAEASELIKELIKLANTMDQRGLVKEADLLDRIINKDDQGI